MKIKVIIIFSFFFLFLLILGNKNVFAQSPIRCGLWYEPCCNLAGSPPDSCQSGLVCQNGICVAAPGVTNPPTRGGVVPNDPRYGCPGTESINTAIGCIPVSNTNSFIGFILRWAIGIGGGMAFLLILLAGFMIITSSGNPERLKAGQELLTSAIAGLILLIFSVFILEVIGVDILKLPGLGTP